MSKYTKEEFLKYCFDEIEISGKDANKVWDWIEAYKQEAKRYGINVFKEFFKKQYNIIS